LSIKFLLCSIILVPWSASAGTAPQAAAKAEFLSFDQAQPALLATTAKLPAELKDSGPLTREKWANFVHKKDADIRARLDRGQADTVVNLLRFGVTFTNEYRIDDDYLVKYGQSSLVNAFAENRTNDLVRAMASGTTNEGIAHLRAFLESKGYSFKTAEGRKAIKSYLLANLARERDEMVRYISRTREDTRFQLFQDRGISLDTNLWPDFLIEQHLASMVEKGLLRPGSVRRVAIVGPGLDFANKQMGNDFYPRQSTQPFAVVDSLIRLGLCNAAALELYTLDISPEVNFHLARVVSNAAAGRAYIVQLPWNTTARMAPDYRRAFIEYWQRLGSSVGTVVPPITVPPTAAADTETRAVKIRPEIVRRLTPLDTNIILQHLALSPPMRFDLIIGTNVFIYFSEFEQSLARLNMALMLKPGGVVLSNEKLQGSPGDGLSDSLQTVQVIARDPDRIDYMFTYVHQK